MSDRGHYKIYTISLCVHVEFKVHIYSAGHQESRKSKYKVVTSLSQSCKVLTILLQGCDKVKVVTTLCPPGNICIGILCTWVYACVCMNPGTCVWKLVSVFVCVFEYNMCICVCVY